MTTKTSKESRGTRYLPDLLLGTLAASRRRSIAGMDHIFPRRAALATPTSGNFTRPATWCGPGTPASSMTSRAQQQFQDALVGNDERALPFIRPAYQALLFVPFSLLPYRSAYLAFLAVNLVLLALAFWLLRPQMRNLCRGMAIAAGLSYFWFFTRSLSRSCRGRIPSCCWLYSRPHWLPSTRDVN